MLNHDTNGRDLSRPAHRKAVIALERTLGCDDPDTLHHYMSLASLEAEAGEVEVALKYMRYAMDRVEMLTAESIHSEIASMDVSTSGEGCYLFSYLACAKDCFNIGYSHIFKY